MLDRIRIVLVGTTHPGNIGAAARAMKTMGLSRLYLVQPAKYPCVEATARASGADDLLAEARVCETLAQALRDCRLVLGTSARERGIRWPVLAPEAGARQIQQTPGETAILFGREHAGLTNEELACCHYRLEIPANPVYSSLNLAAAVQIMAYELRRAALVNPPSSPAEEAMEAPVGYEEMQRFYTHLEQTLIDLDFLDPAKPRRLMHRLHRLFNRAQPNDSEMNILRGILSAAQGAAHKKPDTDS